jgi:hypothetical protein
MLMIRRTIVVSLAILMAPPAAAQTEPAADQGETGEPIVVTGQTEPPPRREVFDQALELSRVDPGRMYEEALARLTTPLCPDVVGLDDDLADEMVARIRANAERIKLRQRRGRCAPNLLIVFADDGQELLTRLAERRPGIFNLVDEAERSEILADNAPVRVWNVVETKRASGAPLNYRRGKPEVPSISGGPGQLFLPTRKDIDFALVVYDREAVLGMTVVQLADYATMRGLSHTRPASGRQPMATILALFDEDSGLAPEEREPDELTSFDIGYLRSVYFWRPERSVPAVGRLLGVRRRAGNAADESLEP